MKIGVAIPCYVGHISKLTRLLDSIEAQTVRPDKVVVSCSSTTERPFPVQIYHYSFPCIIIAIEACRNAAQNRNRAIRQLRDMDYITFMDADDVMHPQRIELILQVFQATNADIVLHNYYTEQEKCAFKPIDHLEYRINEMVPCESGCVRHDDYYRYAATDLIHHSQSSVKASLLDLVRYPEEQEFCIKEDSVFCNRIMHLPNIINAYIANKLSYYEPSLTNIPRT